MKRLTLGDVCKKESSNIAQKNLQDKKGAYPIYGASGLIKQVDFYQQDKEYIAVVKDGAGIGRTMLLPAYSSVIGTMQYLLPKEGIPIDIKYLFYAVEHMNLAKYFSGATIPHIYFRDYQKEPINIPDIETQRKISQIFGKIDALITSRKEQRTKLDQIVKSRFIELFGDPVGNPKGWTMVPLGTRCEIITGNTPSRAEAKNYGEFIEWIKSDNINTPYTFLTEAQEYLSEIGFQKCRFVEAGSLLMTCIAGSVNCIGNVAVADRRVAFNQQINAIVPNEDEVLYLYWLMLLSKPAIHRAINMALKGILSKRQLSEMMFPFPPVALQKQFVTFVEQTDKSKLAIQKSLEKLEILKRALMQKYFG